MCPRNNSRGVLGDAFSSTNLAQKSPPPCGRAIAYGQRDLIRPVGAPSPRRRGEGTKPNISSLLHAFVEKVDRAQPETDEVPLATSDNPAFVGSAYTQSFHKAVALMLRFECHTESWPIAGTFTIARGSKTAAQVVVVKLSDGTHQGQGEAVPYARYHETVEATLAALENAKAEIENGIGRSAIAGLALPCAARNALDCALWDLEAKQRNLPAWHLAGLPLPAPVTTAYTLSLDTPENMARAASAAANRPLLKLKLGRDGDAERLVAVRRAVPDARLIVDANEGWTPENLKDMLHLCKSVDVELVEQPLPAADDEALRDLARDVLICADESAHGLDSLSYLQGKYDAINIKLDKTGGLTPALALAKAAKAANLKIMVGCMLATSLAMAPAFLLASFADYVDLDGPLLLLRDREPAIQYQGSLMQPPPPALWG